MWSAVMVELIDNKTSLKIYVLLRSQMSKLVTSYVVFSGVYSRRTIWTLPPRAELRRILNTEFTVIIYGRNYTLTGTTFGVFFRVYHANEPA